MRADRLSIKKVCSCAVRTEFILLYHWKYEARVSVWPRVRGLNDPPTRMPYISCNEFSQATRKLICAPIGCLLRRFVLVLYGHSLFYFTIGNRELGLAFGLGLGV